MERVHFTREILYDEHIIVYDSNNATPLAMERKTSNILSVLTKATPVGDDGDTHKDLFFIEFFGFIFDATRPMGLQLCSKDYAQKFFTESRHRLVSIEDSGIFKETLKLKELK